MKIHTTNVSKQWPQFTLHIPGIDGTGGVTGLGARLMILLQLGLGQAILWEELLQMSKQLHGHLTYFFPGGAFLIGYKEIVISLFILSFVNIYCCFIALTTFYNMLISFARNINHCLAYSTGDHRNIATHWSLIKWRR